MPALVQPWPQCAMHRCRQFSRNFSTDFFDYLRSSIQCAIARLVEGDDYGLVSGRHLRCDAQNTKHTQTHAPAHAFKLTTTLQLQIISIAHAIHTFVTTNCT